MTSLPLRTGRRRLLRPFTTLLIVTALALAPTSVGAAGADTPEHSSPPSPSPATVQLASSSLVDPWSGDDAQLRDLVRGLVGDEQVEVRNISYTGAPEALGTYTDLATGSPATSSGVILSTGRAVEADPAVTDFASTPLGEPGDQRLSDLVDDETHDAAVLEFEFRTPRPRVTFEYQFASEEYPDFIGSVFNDVFAFDINGSNCATTPTGALVSVNTTQFSEVAGLSYGGITQTLTCSRVVPVGSWNTARLAIADTRDAIYDSAVLLGSGSIRGGQAAQTSPLMFVHGWGLFGATGPDAWDEALELLNEVTGITEDDPAVRVVDSIGASDSISDNASALVQEAQALSAQHGGQPVNVIGHSKGGLDTRLAVSRRPDLFGTVVMLGTPNAGSQRANQICFGVRGWNCSDGSRDLRTASMLELNRTVATPPSVDHWTLGTDRRRSFCGTEERTITEQAESRGYDWWAYGVRQTGRDDDAVCLNSLFALAPSELYASLPADRERGPAHLYRHEPLGYFEDLNHSDVRRDRCALLPAFARVLPSDRINVGTNPAQIPDCPTFHRLPRILDGSANLAAADSADTPVLSLAASGEPVHVLSRVEVLDLTTLPNDGVILDAPEDPDELAEIRVFHDADQVSLIDEDTGAEVPTTTLDDQFGVRSTIADGPFTGADVRLTADGGSQALVQVDVVAGIDEPTLQLDAAAETITVTVAAAPDAPIAGEATLWVGEDEVATGSLDGTGEASVDLTGSAGREVEAVVELAEPSLRVLSGSIVLPDPQAGVGELEGTDDDGTRLTAIFPVTVGEASDYVVNLSVVDENGHVVTPATAAAELEAGETSVAIDLDRAAVRRAVLDGTQELRFVDASIVRVEDGFVTVATDPGPFGLLDPTGLDVVDAPLLGSVSATVEAGELRFDLPVLGIGTTDADLLVEGEVLAPDLDPVATFSSVPSSGVRVTLPASTLKDAGVGAYLLTGASLVDAESGVILDTSPTFSFVVTEGDIPIPPPPEDPPNGEPPREDPGPGDGPSFLLTDIAGTTHEEGIRAIVDAGIAVGFTDGTFRPEQELTRGQMASLLVEAFDLEASGPDATPYVDVAGTTHEASIRAITRAGIAQGYPDGTFRPEAPVKRGHMATLLAGAAGLEADVEPPFTDVAGTTHEMSIRAIAQAGIAQGYPDGTFRPWRAVTRGQMATFLARTLERAPS